MFYNLGARLRIIRTKVRIQLDVEFSSTVLHCIKPFFIILRPSRYDLYNTVTERDVKHLIFISLRLSCNNYSVILSEMGGLTGESFLSELIMSLIKEKVFSKMKEFAPHFFIEKTWFMKGLDAQEGKWEITKVSSLVKNGEKLPSASSPRNQLTYL